MRFEDNPKIICNALLILIFVVKGRSRTVLSTALSRKEFKMGKYKKKLMVLSCYWEKDHVGVLLDLLLLNWLMTCSKMFGKIDRIGRVMALCMCLYSYGKGYEVSVWEIWHTKQKRLEITSNI